MRPALALLPSALLGAAVWRPVAQALTSRGWPVVEAPPQPVSTAPLTTDDQLRRYVDGLPLDRPLVVVPHSNAGLFVPALTATRQVEAMLFVDAGVPPRQGPYDVAPAELYGLLEGLADSEGLLPVWSAWWTEGIAGLFPDPETRARVEAEQRRLPLSYFAESMTATSGWDDRPAAYLAFGDTYEADRAEAERRGWPADTIAGRHLHMLVDPMGVAARIEGLLTQILA